MDKLRWFMCDAMAKASVRGFTGRAAYAFAAGYCRASAETSVDNSGEWMRACAALEVVADNMRREGAE